MTAYRSRSRDPLFDSATQAQLERRGRELFGLALIGGGLLVGAIMGSYSAEDPSWISASDAPVQNWLGAFGAAVAAPVMMVLGQGIWVVVAALIGWGLRFLLHLGAERWVTRLVFAPLAIVVASVWAATLTPTVDWPANFGMGGLFGDTVLAMVLTILPLSPGIAVNIATIAGVFGVVGLTAYASGCTKREARLFGRFLLLGLVMLYDMALKALGRGARLSAEAAQRGAERVQDRRARATRHRDAEADMVLDDDDAPYPARVEPSFRAARAEPPLTQPGASFAAPARMPAPQAKPGLLSGLLKRRISEPLPQPELVEAELPDYGYDMPADPDRISERISSAIRSRALPPAPDEGAPLHAAADHGVFSPVSQLIEHIDHDTELMRTGEEPEPLRPTEISSPRKVVHAAPKRVERSSRQARAEAQPALALDPEPEDGYATPPLSLLLDPATVERHVLSDAALEENARMLENVLKDYGVNGEIVSVRPGPVVTMYELEPAPGLKASRVIGLADDIARSMAALAARVSTVPGRSVIGIELPNANREKVVLREIISHRDFGDGKHALPLALGKDIGGAPVVANLAKMPHLLIAGTTGSGKSVAINTMILSLLYKLTPEECRMIMIDPKMLELSVYDGIPHLLSPVVTDPKKAVVALKWVVGEMEERYRKMSKMGVRNIDGYNGRVKDALARDEMFSRTVQTGFDEETGDPIFETEEFAPEKMPYIVVIVDEMADLMMVAGKEIEACIQRLAQMARASGIHLIMATQRPSVDVITGTIKANFPTRISFQVTSKIDSRTILGEMGAEQLLGMGDMLYMAGGGRINRVHGPFVSDEEVEEVVRHLKSFGPPEYMSGVVEGPSEDASSDIDLVLGLGGNTDGEDALYDQAVAIVIKDRKCSTSYIQRKLAIGYNKAARLVEQMEDEGVVSPANHVGKREILVPEPQ